MSGYKPGSAQFGSIGAVFGEKSHTQTVAEMPSHTHNQDPHSHAIYGSNGGSAGVSISITGNSNGDRAWYLPGGIAANSTATNQYTGGGQAFNVIQPTRAVLVVIKT